MAKPQFTSLICTDFDGTLVDPAMDPPFPAELGACLAQLRNKGTAWAIATGRSLFQAVHGLTQNGISQPPDYIISSERDLFGRTAFNRYVPVGRWNARCAKDHRRLFKANARFFKRVKNHVLTETRARYIETPEEPAGIVATSDEEMDAICGFLHAQMPKVPGIGYERNTVYLRFSHSGYSKGSVIAHLTEHLKLTPDRVFAAGDNYNDLSMLDGRHAKHFACPSNAADAVKTAVREAGGIVAERPAGLGVLDALEHVFAAAARG